MKTNSYNSYIMSDEMALGFLDADGSILLGTYKKTYPSGKKSLGFKVTYFLGQSPSKIDAVDKFAKKFGALVNQQATEFRYNQSSEVGQKVRQFLLKNKPKNPYRRRDFYISEQMIALLNQKTQQSTVGQITLARLASSNYYLVSKGDSDASFADVCAHIGATAAEIEQGSEIAEAMLAQIEVKLEAYKQTLPKTKFSNDYVLGAHFGDGSLYVALSWKPEGGRLRCEPEWAISGDNEAYCQAFANTFNGTTKIVDSKGQCKFVLSGIKKCLSILPFFENAPWMPSYKKEQFSRWKEALRLLEAQEHFTEEGIRKLLDLTYGLAEKGTRLYTKEQYLEWGLAWLKNPNRQKRKPRKT